MIRTDLHTLIDSLPESKLSVARAYLEGLKDGSDTEKAHFLFEGQAGIAEMERGEGIPHEEVVKSLAPWLES